MLLGRLRGVAMRRIWIPMAILACAAVWALADPKGGVRNWHALDGELRAAQRRVALLAGQVAALRAEAAALTDDPIAIEAAIRSDLKLARPGEVVVRVRQEGPMSPDSLTR